MSSSIQNMRVHSFSPNKKVTLQENIPITNQGIGNSIILHIIIYGKHSIVLNVCNKPISFDKDTFESLGRHS